MLGRSESHQLDRMILSLQHGQQRKKLQKKRWFRNAQKWRTGSEGRISLLTRRHGLNRCRYKGLPGIKRWVGFGVIADNLINIGQAPEAPRRRVG